MPYVQAVINCPISIYGAATALYHNYFIDDSALECKPGDVKLVGGTSTNEGRVELCLNGKWRAMCHNGWDTKDAAVVCRQLGFPNQGK